MERITIIGITGTAVDRDGNPIGTSRVGKTTAAKALDLYHDFMPIGLADDMTSIFGRLGGPNGDIFKEFVGDDGYRNAKRLMGTESRKTACVPNVWRAVLKTTIAYLSMYHSVPRRRFVVPDIRYDAEVADLSAFATRLGGRFVLLNVQRFVDDAPSGHSSDIGLRQFSASRTIINEDREEFIGDVVDFGTYALRGQYDSHGGFNMTRVTSETGDFGY